ncbi:hypothetical protein [uncultured Deinococcus sp.]|uniref:hypothetical protein n=1 Tax=uncultured Deinococcus sp. TaxID=158789 RepID=UPI00258F27B1|nr:hypothetical protein [uncultured Deinococcus sp.]
MTQHRPAAPTPVRPPRTVQPAPRALRPAPPATLPLPVPAAQPATLIAEVVLPERDLTAPALPGWTLRLWPVARLGDATLEARPDTPQASAQDLRAALAELGIGVLGPLHPRGRT